MDAIERVYVAGGFGNYLNIGKAVLIGMIPDIPEERYTFMGNTSITGAYLCLLSKELRNEAAEIASKMTYVELRFKDVHGRICIGTVSAHQI